MPSISNLYHQGRKSLSTTDWNLKGSSLTQVTPTGQIRLTRRRVMVCRNRSTIILCHFQSLIEATCIPTSTSWISKKCQMTQIHSGQMKPFNCLAVMRFMIASWTVFQDLELTSSYSGQHFISLHTNTKAIFTQKLTGVIKLTRLDMEEKKVEVSTISFKMDSLVRDRVDGGSFLTKSMKMVGCPFPCSATRILKTKTNTLTMSSTMSSTMMTRANIMTHITTMVMEMHPSSESFLQQSIGSK